jgi:hypothetical protein
MKSLTWIVAALLISALAGCVSPASIVPNTTSADELVKKLGKATDTRPDPRGGEYWDYVYGPEGFTTWRYGIDKGRMVRSAEQLLTLERLHKVVPGQTTEAGVLELLGRPARTYRYRHEVAWEWRVMLRPNTGYYVVRFDFNGVALGAGVLEDSRIDGNDRGSK